LNYETAQIKLRDANLKIRILAERRDLPLEPGTIIAQTPQGGERVDCGTVIGVTMSGEDHKRTPQNLTGTKLTPLKIIP
jgi:beta-lactam-binding protein with PASTA domain